MDYSFTGDPQVDQQILQNLYAQMGNVYQRERGRLGESLTARGFGGLGGMYDQGLSQIIAEQAGNEGQANIAMAHASAERYRQQREREQALQDQMRLMEYQHKLNRPRKLNPWQAAIMGAGTGASIGSAAGPWGAAGGGLAGGIAGYTDPDLFGGGGGY